MPAKIVILGAGSMGFTQGLTRDMLTFPLLRDAEIVLMDINKERLGFAKKAVDSIVERGKYPAKVVATLDRKEALKGADAVLSTILSSPLEVWRHDLEIPRKYGIDIAVGDTMGPSGIFRALRTIPVMLDICKDMERLCPKAPMLNYTNPMSMLCRAMQKNSFIKSVGLCHSVQGRASILADMIKTPMDQITYLCAGINHQAWFIEYNKNGKDAYPLIRQAVKKRENYMKNIVCNEVFLHLGYYLTEGGGHETEYNWWFRKRPDLIQKYDPHRGIESFPPELRKRAKEILKKEKGIPPKPVMGYLIKQKYLKEDLNRWVKQIDSFSLERGHEFASYIVNAMLGGEPFKFNGNVPNKGIITNLPQDVCVEVPVLADRCGFNLIHVGALPPQCAAINNINVAVQEMAVEASLTGDPTLLCRSIYFDPLTAAVLSLAEIKKMVGEMLQKNKNYLPQFKSVKI